MIGKTLLSERQKGATHSSYSSTDFIRSIDQTIDNMLLHKQPDKHNRIEIDLIPPSAFNSIKKGEQLLLVQNSVNRPLFAKTAFLKNIIKLL